MYISLGQVNDDFALVFAGEKKVNGAGNIFKAAEGFWVHRGLDSAADNQLRKLPHVLETLFGRCIVVKEEASN